MYKHESRSQQGMLIAAADLLLIIPFLILGSFLLIDASLSSCYKQSLGLVVSQAAQHAANLPPGQDPIEPTESLVREMVKSSALKVSDLKVTVKQIDIDNCAAIQVSARGMFALLAGTALPVSIPVQDTAVALVPPNRVCAVVAITPGSYAQQYPGRAPTLFVPVIQPTTGAPIWTFPYATSIGSVSVESGAAPKLPPQQPASSKGYFQGRESLY